MIVTVDLHAAKAVLRLDNGFKRLPFIAVKSINDTGKAVQKAVRAQISSVFAVRKPFVLQQVKYFGASFNKASGVGKWEARVGIGIGGGLDKGGKFLLPRFELGGINTPNRGRRNVPVPIAARPSKAGPILPEFTFKGMQLKAYKAGRLVRRPGRRKSAERGYGTTGDPVPSFALSGVQFKGQGGTFLIRRRTGQLAIFQRSGNAVRLIWAFVTSVRLDPRLKFYAVAKRTIAQTFAPALRREINDVFGRAAK